MIQKISRIISNYEVIMPLLPERLPSSSSSPSSPSLTYHEDQPYPKTINRSSPLDPYDRGGLPFTQVVIESQYPENSPTAGYVTTYLTPLSWFIANSTLHAGTTIVAHPGGILDEILYNTRGLDTVVEPTILFIAFAIASYLFRKG